MTGATASAERGRAARSTAPRSVHGAWAAPPDRRDPVDVLVEQDATRVPVLVPIRHGRMLASPFAFFRGAAAVMAHDLAPTPVSGLDVQLCGDAHLANFGAFAAPDRALVFDLNDFDETHRGPWEWDVKRLAASVELAGRDRGFKPSVRRNAVLAAAGGYRRAMRDFAAMRTLDVWYQRVDIEARMAAWGQDASRGQRRRLAAGVERARRKDSLRALAKLTVSVDGRPRIRSDPPLVVPLEQLVPDDEADAVRDGLPGVLAGYQRSVAPDRRHLLAAYRPVDIAHKVVGVGSVGTQSWIVLMLGADASDPLFLQVKEAGPSVLAAHCRGAARRAPDNQGRRVVEGQRLLQAASDVFLGWVRIDRDVGGRRRDYYVRQLWDAKGSVAIEQLRPAGLGACGALCGWTLARAHARSGDRAAIAAYLGGSDRFDRAVARFATTYADLTERDHAALGAAVAAGRVEADRAR